MEPISMTLGALAVAMYVKAIERTTDAVSDAAADAGVNAATKALRVLRDWLRAKIGGERTALEAVEVTPTSELFRDRLIGDIDRAAEADPVFASELRALVEAAGSAGVSIGSAGSVEQVADGNYNIQVAHSEKATITQTLPSPGAQPPTA